MMRLLTFLLFVFISLSLHGEQTFDYQLKPEKIAADTYVFIGKKEDFTLENGGNIVNTGFIVTTEGVVVIDTGPSLIYGQQMRDAISTVTDKPVVKVLLTHHHPDHIFGNQAFTDVPIYALPETVKAIKLEAAGFLDNVYRMVGDWMKNTDVINDIQILEQEQEDFSNHKLRYLSRSGHTNGDMLILDETTGVLFAGDMIFHNRTLTTPHAHPETWLSTLNDLKNLDFEIIVPGHGEVAKDLEPINQTIDYLSWLEKTIRDAVEQGKEMNETLQTPIPERFRNMGVLLREFTRSVIHRYPVYEAELFETM